MSAVWKRLSNRRGESLIESLVSILVLVFTSLLFISMITGAANINKTVQDDDNNFQKAREILDRDSTIPSETKNIDIYYAEETTPGASFPTDNRLEQDVTVEWYSKDDLYAFYPTEPSGG